MSIAFVRRAGIACLGLGIVAVVVLMVPTRRAVATPAGQLEACINPGNGMMRLVDSNTACHANETRVEWDITGPQGPAGPQGPQGPAGSSSGGPPFVWVCTPTGYNQLGNSQSNIYIFNGSATTANVAAHFLNKDGTNLAGVAIPGASPPNDHYPGQTGSTTVPLSSANTMILPYQTPSGNPASGGDVVVTVTVVSDQPATVSSDAQFDGPHPVPCSLLPK